MKKYWKVKLIEDLLKIRSKEKEGSTITMSYQSYQEEQKRLIEQAYEDGWNEANKEDN